MEKILIKDTTKEERMELIKSWVPEDEAGEDCDIDLWEMYRDYIDGKREIAEINAAFNEGFYEEEDLKDNEVNCGPGTKPGQRGNCPVIY